MKNKILILAAAVGFVLMLVLMNIFLNSQKSEYVDLYSLELIESAQATYNKFVADKATPKWTEEILEDFQMVDYHLVEATLTRIQIPPNYL